MSDFQQMERLILAVAAIASSLEDIARSQYNLSDRLAAIEQAVYSTTPKQSNPWPGI